MDNNIILKSLGYNHQEIDEQLMSIIEESKKDVLRVSNFKYTYEHFDITKGYKIENSDIFLEGNDIKKHLKSCDSLIMLCTTLGIEIDRLIKKNELINMTKYFILDTIASIYVEEKQNEIISKLNNEYKQNNKYLTHGFGIGYGDLPIHFQKTVINILKADKKIGVTVNENSILLPRKSTTTIIGISNIETKGSYATCENCKIKEKCEKRKLGVFCGD